MQNGASVSRRIYRYSAEEGLLSLAAPVVGVKPALAAIHGALQAFVEHDAYPCVGAKSALHRGAYRLVVYGEMGSPEAVEQMAEDVQWFAANADRIDPAYATFVTVFEGPAIRDEEHFEESLWKQLQGVHDVDARDFGWDAGVSSDSEAANFSFSVGGKAFFIVGMHPEASREARRFPFPTLVWNLHVQFERLREQGVFERMKHVIREREEELQGEPNEELADYGASSEARQYSGRRHEGPWECPFRAKAQEKRE